MGDWTVIGEKRYGVSMTTAEKLIKIRRGLDVPVLGEPAQEREHVSRVRSVALLGRDYLGLKPELHTAVGDRIRQGQPLFGDRANPGVLFTAPVSGTVTAVNRGPRRRLESVVIECGDGEPLRFDHWPSAALEILEQPVIRANLLASGLWTAFRTRPFGRVPAADATPAAIFVTAIDTNPLAAQPHAVIARDPGAFNDGLAVLRQLTAGAVHVCVSPDSAIKPAPFARVKVTAFGGPHPAGLVGTHIHYLHPVEDGASVWHINYQDVIALGRLFVTGHLDTMRTLAVAGPRVHEPGLVRAPLGAHVEDVIGDGVKVGPHRVISGSVLAGHRAVGPHAYLGRYHLQLCVLSESVPREFLGWLMPGRNRYSASRLFASRLMRARPFDLTTSQNGSPRALVPIGSFEKVMPLDVLITPLLKALLVGDTESAKSLGCLALDEEDLALCSFVCCSKYDYGSALRETLTTIEKTG